MTSPSPAIQAEAERICPCAVSWPLAAHVCRDGKHDEDCPAYYRPAVASALQAKQGEIDRLHKAVDRAAEVFIHYGDLHAAKPDMVKAKRNYDLAGEMAVALTPALNPPASTGEQKDKAE